MPEQPCCISQRQASGQVALHLLPLRASVSRKLELGGETGSTVGSGLPKQPLHHCRSQSLDACPSLQMAETSCSAVQYRLALMRQKVCGPSLDTWVLEATTESRRFSSAFPLSSPLEAGATPRKDFLSLQASCACPGNRESSVLSFGNKGHKAECEHTGPTQFPLVCSRQRPTLSLYLLLYKLHFLIKLTIKMHRSVSLGLRFCNTHVTPADMCPSHSSLSYEPSRVRKEIFTHLGLHDSYLTTIVCRKGKVNSTRKET